MKWLRGFYEAKEARNKALKAHEEYQESKTRKLLARDVYQKTQKEKTIGLLAEKLRHYAEHVKKEKTILNISFNEDELASVLGDERDQLADVLRFLEENGRAKKSFVFGHWHIR